MTSRKKPLPRIIYSLTEENSDSALDSITFGKDLSKTTDFVKALLAVCETRPVTAFSGLRKKTPEAEALCADLLEMIEDPLVDKNAHIRGKGSSPAIIHAVMAAPLEIACAMIKHPETDLDAQYGQHSALTALAVEQRVKVDGDWTHNAFEIFRLLISSPRVNAQRTIITAANVEKNIVDFLAENKFTGYHACSPSPNQRFVSEWLNRRARIVAADNESIICEAIKNTLAFIAENPRLNLGIKSRTYLKKPGRHNQLINDAVKKEICRPPDCTDLYPFDTKLIARTERADATRKIAQIIWKSVMAEIATKDDIGPKTLNQMRNHGRAPLTRFLLGRGVAP